MHTYEKEENDCKRYWIPREDKTFKGVEDRVNITTGKKYEILIDENSSIYIIDDAGKPSAIFLGHNGDFIGW